MAEFATNDVHKDAYPSEIAMAAAVELEVAACLGRIQTQTVGKIIQRAIDKAFAEEREAVDLHAAQKGPASWD